jgi:hypothetical protein
MSTILGLTCIAPPSQWTRERQQEWMDVYDSHHPTKGGANYTRNFSTARGELLAAAGANGTAKPPATDEEHAQRHASAAAGFRAEHSAEFRSGEEFRHFAGRHIRLKHNPQEKFVRPRTTSHQYGWRPAQLINGGGGSRRRVGVDGDGDGGGDGGGGDDDDDDENPDTALYTTLRHASEESAKAAAAVALLSGARRCAPGSYGQVLCFPKNRGKETEFADHLLASGTVKNTAWFDTGSSKCEFLSGGLNGPKIA